MMKKKTLTTLASLAAIGTSNAAVINLERLSNTDWASPTTNASFVSQAVVSVNGVVVGDRAGSPSAGDGSNTASLDVSTFILDDVAQPAPLAYTVSSLDLDGVGGNNDSIVVTLSVSTDGQNIQTIVDATPEPRNAGWLSSGANTNAGNTLNADGEYIQFDVTSLLVNLNGGTGNGSGSFDGFTGMRIGAYGTGDVAMVNGTSYTNGIDSNVVDLTPGGLDPNLRVSFDAAAGSAGTFRPDSFDIQLTVVPEPGTGLLLALGCLAFMRRRR